MKRFGFALLAMVALSSIGCSIAAVAGNSVAGEKIDSGLGQLPHYSTWSNSRAPIAKAQVSIPGESLDSGLGALPHYTQWKDAAGRDPLGLNPTLLSAFAR